MRDAIHRSIKLLACDAKLILIAKTARAMLFRHTRENSLMLRFVVVALTAVLSISAARAADVKVLAALAVQDALDPLAAQFSRTRGAAVRVDYSTVGAIRKRLAGGERADVVVLTADAIDEMDRAGELLAGTSAPVAATRTGLAIRAGAA